MWTAQESPKPGLVDKLITKGRVGFLSSQHQVLSLDY